MTTSDTPENAQFLRKLAAAKAALKALEIPRRIGIGTGSTIDCFIDCLAEHSLDIVAVSSSQRTTARLARHGIDTLAAEDCDGLDLYIDGADEINARFQMIKGGGGALTQEKIVAAMAKRFICIADQSKQVERLGAFPLPFEVLAPARSWFCRMMSLWGATARIRPNLSDNQNLLIDVVGLTIDDNENSPDVWERRLNDLPGVVCNGLFALRPADELFVANDQGVSHLVNPSVENIYGN